MTEFVREIVSGPSDSGQSKIHIEIRFRDPFEQPDRFELESLLSAWYTVGSQGGYEGVLLHQFESPKIDAAEVRLAVVVGGDPRGALEVLGRCLDELEESGVYRVESATTRESTYR